MYNYKPVVLVVLDGWGEWETMMGNPLSCANLPTIHNFNSYYPKLVLEASGLAVGLPWGVFGNSEVGHQTLGSGQIIYHYLPTISASIHSRRFYENLALLSATNWTKKHKSRLHLLGLLSDGGVHSHVEHLFALLKLAKEQQINEVFIHVLTDGRDAPTNAGIKIVRNLLSFIKEIEIGQIASISGRYFIMDRNRNWDRVEKAFLAYSQGIGIKEDDPLQAIEKQYRNKITDEYLEPVVMVDNNKEPVGLIKEGDAVINFNFRADRARQISRVFCTPNFDKFKQAKVPGNIKYVGFTQYAKDIKMEFAYPPQEISTRLADIISQKGKKQLRIAEMEKFAHVTYFFNGGLTEPFPGEDRIFVQSKNVRSYASVPEMSAYEVTTKLTKAVGSGKYDFVLVNFANPDMVGHTGVFKAGIKAVEVVDECLGKLVDIVLKQNGCLLVTADHGNIEEMVNLETGEIDTQHSNNPVPFWLITPSNKKRNPVKSGPLKFSGMIADVAPTILELFNIPTPNDMIGNSLLDKIK